MPEPQAGRQVRALQSSSSERVAELSRTASPRCQRPNQEKQSRNQSSSTKPQQRREALREEDTDQEARLGHL